METLGSLPSPTQPTAALIQPVNNTQQPTHHDQISGNTRVSQLQPGQLSQNQVSQLSQLQAQNMGNINVGQLTVDQLRQASYIYIHALHISCYIKCLFTRTYQHFV